MVEEIIDKVITIEQKKKFYQFLLDIYNGKIEIVFELVFELADLKSRGFCWSYYYFFGIESGDFELLPELRRHKPRKYFYDSDGWQTDDKNQFWFPLGENKKRIELCEKILEKLNK